MTIAVRDAWTRDDYEDVKDPMNGRPLRRGDTKNIVVELSLDIASLRFIAHALPYDDEYTKDLWKILDEVLAAIKSEDAARRDKA